MGEAGHVAQLLGVAAACLSLVDPVPYLRDVLRGRTRPHRATWGIWSVLGLLALAAQADHRVDWSLGLLAVQAVTILTTFLLSLRRGEGGTGLGDVVILLVAGAGALAWLAADDPRAALVGVVLADSAAFLPMLPKAWWDPWSETWQTYVIAGTAGGCSAGAVMAADANLIYPLYFCLANTGFGLLLLARRRRIPGPAVLPGADRPSDVDVSSVVQPLTDSAPAAAGPQDPWA